MSRIQEKIQNSNQYCLKFPNGLIDIVNYKLKKFNNTVENKLQKQ